MLTAERALVLERPALARAVHDVDALDRARLAAVAAGLASTLGLLVVVLGAERVAVLLIGGAALCAAASSAYLTLGLLVVLILVPLQDNALPLLGLNQLDAVYLAGLAGLALRMVGRRRQLVPTPLGLALLAFVASGALSLAAGLLGDADGQSAFGGFRGLYGYAGIPLLALDETSPGRRRALAALVCVVAGLTAARGLLSWAELNGLHSFGGVLHRLASPDAEEQVGAVPALAGSFGYVRAWAGNFEGNSLGAFLVLVLPVGAYLTFRGPSRLRRGVFAALTALMLWALVVTYSRGAYLGLLAASLPLLLLQVGRRSPASGIALLLAGAVALLVLSQQVPGAEDRLITLRSPGGDPTVQHRQLVYGHALDAFAGSPVWGVGLGTPLREIGTGADSLYFFLLLRAGLIGLGAFAALAWAGGRRMLDGWRRGRLGGLELAIASGLLGFAVHSLVDFALWNPKVALTAWLLVALLLPAAHGGKRPEQRVAVRAEGEPW